MVWDAMPTDDCLSDAIVDNMESSLPWGDICRFNK